MKRQNSGKRSFLTSRPEFVKGIASPITQINQSISHQQYKYIKFIENVNQ
jgi:hypothetical protein